MRGVGVDALHFPLIPTEVGIQTSTRRGLGPWIPAFAGMSGVGVDALYFPLIKMQVGVQAWT